MGSSSSSGRQGDSTPMRNGVGEQLMSSMLAGSTGTKVCCQVKGYSSASTAWPHRDNTLRREKNQHSVLTQTSSIAPWSEILIIFYHLFKGTVRASSTQYLLQQLISANTLGAVSCLHVVKYPSTSFFIVQFLELNFSHLWETLKRQAQHFLWSMLIL